MNNDQDNQQKFVEFYSNLVRQYEKVIRSRTMFAALFGAGFFTVSALFLLYIFIGNDVCAH